MTLWFGGCELHLHKLINGSQPAPGERDQQGDERPVFIGAEARFRRLYLSAMK
jgi:hypothetical protein